MTEGKKVIELGAGVGLVGLVAALCTNARSVVVTDGDEEVVKFIRHNVETTVASLGKDRPTRPFCVCLDTVDCIEALFSGLLHHEGPEFCERGNPFGLCPRSLSTYSQYPANRLDTANLSIPCRRARPHIMCTTGRDKSGLEHPGGQGKAALPCLTHFAGWAGVALMP